MIQKDTIKISVLFFICVLFRLLPFRAPNVEPILATQMPIAKKSGALAGFCFGALSILAFDLITGTLGLWSIFTAGSYGLLGAGAAWYFKHRSGRTHLVLFAVIGTIFYDAATGLTVGPLFFGVPFMAALIGQIPFTLMHLLGNVSLSLVWSPLIERWMHEIQIPNPKSQITDKLQIPISKIPNGEVFV